MPSAERRPPLPLRAIAHDLRQSLACALHLGDVLAGGDLEPHERQRALEGLRASLVALERFATNLTDLERIVEGTWRPEPAIFDLERAVRDAVARAGSSLAVRTSGDHLSVVADPAMVARALDIIISRSDEQAESADEPLSLEEVDDDVQVQFGCLRHASPATTATSADRQRDVDSLAMDVAARLIELQGGQLWWTPDESGYGLRLPRAIEGAFEHGALDEDASVVPHVD